MFSWLTGKNKKHPPPVPAQTESVSPGNTFLRNAEGFWLPQRAQTLLSAPKRQRWLQQISPVVALPEREYRVLCLEPLHRLAEALQCVPAGRNGHYQGEGGLLDLTLHTTAWCIRMSQKEMLPRGVPAEEQSRQFSAWNVCVFYTGLLYWLPLAMQFDGQLSNLHPWQPGLISPPAPFRFRFRDPLPAVSRLRQTGGALMAVRLLPADAVEWLSGYPAALAALTEVLTGQAGADNDLMRVLSEALDAFDAGSLPEVTAGTDSPVSLVLPQTTDMPAVAPDAAPAGQMTETGIPAAPEPDSVIPSVPLPGQTPETAPLSPADAAMPAFALAAPDERMPVVNRDAEAPVADTGATVLDGLVAPDADLHYALMLSGVLPAEPSAEVPESEISETLPEPAAAAGPVTAESEPLPEPVLSPDIPDPLADTGPNSVSADVLAADFTDWLKRALGGETLPLNVPGGPVHAVAGYLFLRSPRIFTLYLRQCPYSFERYQPVQRAFESLHLYRRAGNPSGGLVHCRLRKTGTPDEPPARQKAAGYLVKSRLLLPGEDISDSPYIEFD
ncbi:TraI domain-containing protein [Providencia rettgeri]|uniref:TraI domain-containing protein n=1 Tax=Providencia rettgeri TaxID=587 RepID=UPI0024AAA58D